MSKKLIYIIGGVVAVLLLVVLILPLVVNVNQYRPTIESLMGGTLNRKVDIGNIRLSILSGGVSVEDLAIADDPAFSNGPFLKARSVTVGVELMPLLFSRALHVTGLTIDQPEVNLLRSSSGIWNFSTLGATAGKTASQTGGAAPSGFAGNPGAGLVIQNVAIKNGSVALGNVGANSKTHRYEQVNLTASNLSTTTEFPFQVDLKTPGDGSIALKGKAGPLNPANTAETPVDASLEVKGVDLTASGFVDPSSGIGGVVDFTGTLTSDGKQATTKGTVTASKLQLAPGSTPAGEPVKVDYETQYDLARQSGTLKQGDVHLGKALAQLTGTYKTAGDATTLQMKCNGKDMPAADIASLLPAVGAALPSGASLTEGTLNVDLTISGPLDHLVIAGPVNLSNAKLSGYDLGSKMKALSALARIPSGSDTVVQAMSSTFRVATDGIRADNFNLVVPAIGTMTGNGTITPDHKLNFKMKAALSSAASPLGAISSLASLGGGQKGGGGIPFMIQGTTSNPTFLPDFGGLASGLGGGAANGAKSVVPNGGKDIGGALGGLFGKKK